MTDVTFHDWALLVAKLSGRKPRTRPKLRPTPVIVSIARPYVERRTHGLRAWARLRRNHETTHYAIIATTPTPKIAWKHAWCEPNETYPTAWRAMKAKVALGAPLF